MDCENVQKLALHTAQKPCRYKAEDAKHVKKLSPPMVILTFLSAKKEQQFNAKWSLQILHQRCMVQIFRYYLKKNLGWCSICRISKTQKMLVYVRSREYSYRNLDWKYKGHKKWLVLHSDLIHLQSFDSNTSFEDAHENQILIALFHKNIRTKNRTFKVIPNVLSSSSTITLNENVKQEKPQIKNTYKRKSCRNSIVIIIWHCIPV